MTDELAQTESLRAAMQSVLDALIVKLGPIRIGAEGQYPYGWRRAGMGRTVWRLVEEAIVQGLEFHAKDLGLHAVEPATSEVGVHDVLVSLGDPSNPCHLNIKAAADGGRSQKDDVSKAASLHAFFSGDPGVRLFLATLYMHFTTSDGALLVDLRRSSVFPVAWIPDIYVNPSNNGNLQSAHYRNIASAIKRTNAEFLIALEAAMEVAARARARKSAAVIGPAPLDASG